MIDMAIVQMFAMIAKDIFLGVIGYITNGTGVTLSLNDTMALPVLLLLIIGIMALFIGVFMGYHWLCYRLLGTSLSRALLSVKVVSKDDELLTKQRYLKREFDKDLSLWGHTGLVSPLQLVCTITFTNPPLARQEKSYSMW
ncbi:RDD family protein [Photobacterium leiognathi]|uniref:RDD family protein n=1 Tax=Photobacterium leiognathi TaxID=553611 RepID=UPI0027338D23|nr:RDD family protein [Photobacterium leiognathi]